MRSILGVLLATLSMVLAAAMDVTVRLMSLDLKMEQVLVLRAAWSLVFIAPILILTKGRIIKTNKFIENMSLGAVASISAYLAFLAIATIPIAEANAYFISESIFLIPLAVIFLREPMTISRVSGVVLGVAGVLVILSPELTHFSGKRFGIAMAIGSALFGAVLAVMLRRLSIGESSIAMVFYLQLTTLILFSIPSVLSWQPVTVEQAAFGAILAVLVLTIYVLSIFAYRYAEAIVLAPAWSTAVPFSALAAWLMFDEIPSFTLWLGLVLITVAVVVAQLPVRRN